MKKLTPMGIVIDRQSMERFAPAIDELGGAFADMFQLWRRSEMEFLIMLAHTQKRLRLRAPLTWMCASEIKLRETMRVACANLDGVTVAWLIDLAEGSRGQSIVRAELLLDAKPIGAA